jgi:hypothetical protein
MNSLFLKKHTLLVVLAITSIMLYLLDYFLLGSSRDITASFLGNLAFLPVYVIFVTLMVEEIMRERERDTLMRKLNMVIGVFFSEVGNSLLKELSGSILSSDELRKRLHVNGEWSGNDFQSAGEYLRSCNISFVTGCTELQRLKEFLVARRTFLVGLLENQNLLEHEQFTDLLWAVFHLVEELEARHSFDGMPQSDIEHLNGDMQRVFGCLSREWVLYMQHLKRDYPYLFSLAVRLNPMVIDPDPQVY